MLEQLCARSRGAQWLGSVHPSGDNERLSEQPSLETSGLHNQPNHGTQIVSLAHVGMSVEYTARCFLRFLDQPAMSQMSG